MIDFWLHPSLILISGALALVIIPPAVRRYYLIALPAATVVLVSTMPLGEFGVVPFLDWQLFFGRVDGLSYVFVLIMAVMCLLASFYAMNVKDTAQQVAAWIYAAGSIGVILAGDFLVLFLFWELMALSSVFLIWARRTPTALAAGFRYLMVHMVGGTLLLAGIVLHGAANDWNFAFEAQSGLEPTVGVWLMLGGILLNAAAPPLHAWLPDAYPAATFSGAVFLSAFTTKTAVYALCRGFAGFEILITIGVVMALYGVVHAFLANDARRLLSYHIVSQVGFMVVGIGIGTELAVNGAIAHAVAHILYKGLLFMGCGSVLYTTGTIRFTELGGLRSKMPLTMLFTLVGALSISGVPLFSGFISKSMTITASYEAGYSWAGYMLMLASIGTFLSIGIKLIHLIWFGECRSKPETLARASDPSWNMTAAMATTALLCIIVGVFPGLLYRFLPYTTAYTAFSTYHVMETLQLLGFGALGYYVLRRKLAPKAATNRDVDSLYQPIARGLQWICNAPLQSVDRLWSSIHERHGILSTMRLARKLGRFDNEIVDGVVNRTASTVLLFGSHLRSTQRGSLQQNLTLAFAIVAIVVGAIVFLIE